MAKKKSSLSGMFRTTKQIRKDAMNRVKLGSGVVLGRLTTGLVMKAANKLSHDAQNMTDILTLAAGGALSLYADNPIIEGAGYGIASDAVYEMILNGDMFPQKLRDALGLTDHCKTKAKPMSGVNGIGNVSNEDIQDFDQMLDQADDLDDEDWEMIDQELQGLDNDLGYVDPDEQAAQLLTQKIQQELKSPSDVNYMNYL